MSSRRRPRPLAPVLLAAAVLGLVLASCGGTTSTSTSTSGNASSGSPSSVGPSPSSAAPGTTASAVSPTSPGRLLAELATGSDAEVFDERYFATVGDVAGGEGSLLAVGTSGDDAVAYWCDGEKDAWFTGTRSADGTVTLRETGGDGEVVLSGAGDATGLRAELSGSTTGTATADAGLAKVADSFLRVEGTATSDPDSGDPAGIGSAIGGVIIRDGIVRGVIRVGPGTGASVPPSTLAPSNPASSSTTATSTAPSLVTPPRVREVTIRTPATIDLGPGILTVTGSGATDVAACAAALRGIADGITASVRNASSITTTITQLEQRRAQARAELDALGTPPSDAARATELEKQIKELGAAIDGLRSSLAQVHRQIDALQAQADTLRSSGGCG